MSYELIKIQMSLSNLNNSLVAFIFQIIDGEYYYVGRKDRRIKLFGHIVDLSKIEVAISMKNHIEHCCCFFIPDENKIIAFVEAKNDDFDSNELNSFLRAQLPSVMIPSNIYVVKIPVNRHGKNS